MYIFMVFFVFFIFGNTLGTSSHSELVAYSLAYF